ncbi:Bro-N domain-containing protein [Ruminococcus sp.]|uniref:BRO-N domain-containing protein n=1 Tax=Ruminococcus sp. TaxID=41978 RepID=UPI0038693EB1
MNQLQVFSNERLGKIRTMNIDGQPYFVGKDIAEILGYADPQKAMKMHIDDEDKLTRQIVVSGQNRNVTVINESGVYSLILSSKLPKAKEFKRWVTSEVLPSIRKTGGYNSQVSEEYKQKRLEAMMMNAKARLMKEQNRRIELMIKNPDFKPSEYGVDVPVISKVYTATQVGEMFGVSANKIGRIATANKLKTEEYGEWFKDKAKYADKEVPSFRYNEKGIEKLRELLAESD